MIGVFKRSANVFEPVAGSEALAELRGDFRAGDFDGVLVKTHVDKIPSEEDQAAKPKRGREA